MVAVRGILTRLRKRSGLSSDRLDSTEIDITTLLQLSVVRRYVHLSGTAPRPALLRVIAHVARQLPPTQQLIVDAELCLGLLEGQPASLVDPSRLYAPDLGDRRVYLTEQWQGLHRALGVPAPPPTPSVRTLRDTPEQQAFTALAELLTTGSELDIVRMAELDAGQANTAPRRGTVTVIGDAVTDLINVVETFPEPGSALWGDFDRHPGGKGLNRAVALARLGFDSRLIASIGADAAGREIVDYLREEGVDTSLVKVTNGGTTPVTTVIQTLEGQSSYIAFRQDRLRLTESDFESPAVRGAIRRSDAVLVTCEQPIDIVARVLAMVHSMDPRPWLIINTSPPTVFPRHMHEHLEVVDYLIGTRKEVAATWPNSSADQSTNRLLQLGVRAVCILEDVGCRVRSLGVDVVIPHIDNGTPFVATGASSAFTTALVYRLTTARRPAERSDFEWAVRAVFARLPVLNIPDAMPSADRIDRMVATEPENRPGSP
ncbi:carbohydrate kinase family protein [Nocardia sp. SYP-A9097]|uniref:carbohydrate kinase family protein n=1 Tax=Nocardia sp. SYP-A9097 TaxID=2663237 RepID=UPI001E444426|nr:carbohydrate kinase family protein [Nocardia sp. SYP-A9097]